MTNNREHDLTPSLFDAPVDALVDDSDDEWAEVPPARFLSWSHAMQLHYCWRRDLDAAVRAESSADAQFFLTRAAGYQADLDQVKRG